MKKKKKSKKKVDFEAEVEAEPVEEAPVDAEQNGNDHTDMMHLTPTNLFTLDDAEEDPEAMFADLKKKKKKKSKPVEEVSHSTERLELFYR